MKIVELKFFFFHLIKKLKIRYVKSKNNDSNKLTRKKL